MNKILHFLHSKIGDHAYYKILYYYYSLFWNTKLCILKRKKKINIVFFVVHSSVWKYDSIYKLFNENTRFNPIIIIVPYILGGDDIMHQDMNNAFIHFKKKGYNVIKSLKDNNTWIDIKKEINPDIIFFTNPYNLTKWQYTITNFKKNLTCYVPYNFGNSHMLNMFHNEKFHNVLWRFFVETPIHQEYSKKIAYNKGINTINTGFPGTDDFLFSNNELDSTKIWKHQNTKKIIWAPHHTIDDDKSFISFSSFLSYHQTMFDLLEKYQGNIEIIFKPHPLLRLKLYNHPEWGQSRTDKYYKSWENNLYGGINENEYIELFKTSDALIHDSGSFLIEYLYTSKPVLRTDRDNTICERLNTFGQMAYKVHYIAKNSNEISDFIENVVLKENDPKSTERNKFKIKYLLPPNNVSASQNIYDYILKKLL